MTKVSSFIGLQDGFKTKLIHSKKFIFPSTYFQVAFIYHKDFLLPGKSKFNGMG